MFWFFFYVSEVKEKITKTPEVFPKCCPKHCLEVCPHSSHSEVYQTPKPQKASGVSNQHFKNAANTEIKKKLSPICIP